MVALTYGDARAPSADAAAKVAAKAATASAAARKPWYVHLYDAIIEARLQQARREIRLYTHLMPHTIDERGNRKLKTEMGDMPFGGW